MDESLLHFIWKFQKIDTSALCTADDEEVHVFQPGLHNLDSGPDFHNARIKIDGLEWNGHVEIHVRASDWLHHRHVSDPAYDNVVLHVVWQNDAPALRADGTHIPTLELKDRVELNLVANYKKYLNAPREVLCAEYLPDVPSLTWLSNLDRMLALRLQEKSKRILATADALNHDWEEVAYRTLARTFGFSLNADSFEAMAESLPLKVPAKHANQPNQVQALIFGQAGFLEDVSDEFGLELKKEYAFLLQKYQLQPRLHRSHWKFGRMRPSNFPTVRLAQFAAIISRHPALFSTFMAIEKMADLKRMLNPELPDYWQTHYDFGKALKKGTNQMGAASLEIIIINSVVPTLAAYAQHTDQPELMERATSFLEKLPPEKNRYTEKWTALNLPPKSAFDSQAQITLFREFCSRKKCLTCTIGSSIFNK